MFHAKGGFSVVSLAHPPHCDIIAFLLAQGFQLKAYSN
jgi:hypothetical protein